jgi:Zn-dependent protease with chaperone function
MGARLSSWWLKIKTHPITSTLIVLFIAFVVLVIFGGYKLNWDWTGFNGNSKSGKTLWDWMQLLFIPVVLAIAGFWFNHRERKAAELRAEIEQNAAERRAEAEQEIEQQRTKAEREISEDSQREAALQAYINNMSELLLHEKLRESGPNDEVRKIARVRTLTVLPRLDGDRSG